MNEVMRLLVKEHLVVENEADIDEQLVHKAEALRTAGYQLQANIIGETISQQKLQVNIIEAKKKYGMILKIPQFENMVIGHGLRARHILSMIPIVSGLTYIIAGSWWAVPMSVVAGIVGPLIAWAYHDIYYANAKEYTTYEIGHNQLIVEADPKDYMGEVPEGIVQATTEAWRSGLTPKIWALTNRQQISEIMQGHYVVRMVDPLLVGYMKEINGYVVLLGIWGKDIEDLSKLTL